MCIFICLSHVYYIQVRIRVLVCIYQGDRAVFDVDGVDFHYDVPLEPVYMYLYLHHICIYICITHVPHTRVNACVRVCLPMRRGCRQY